MLHSQPIGVAPHQRHTRANPCRVCGGFDSGVLRGRGARCWGYLSRDHEWAFCTRPEYAGALLPAGNSQAYLHRLNAPCPCGSTHGGPAPTPIIRHQATTRSRNTRYQEPAGEVDRYYEYLDEASKPLHRTVRFKNPKSFRQQRFENGYWKWGLRDIRRVLYRLPELIRTPLDVVVFMPEGEKDADRLAALGLAVTTSAAGVNGWQSSFCQYLRGRDVIIIEDNDDDGAIRTRRLIEDLSPVTKRLRVGWFSSPKKGYDVANWLDEGHTVAELLTSAYTTSAVRLTWPVRKDQRST